MRVNLRRGFIRLWLFASLLWVIFCGWQIIDASLQKNKAVKLLEYYSQQQSVNKPAGSFWGAQQIVPDHLSEQVEFNQKTFVEQGARNQKFLYLLWFVPLVTLPFAVGVPWVLDGFCV